MSIGAHETREKHEKVYCEFRFACFVCLVGEDANPDFFPLTL
jgi:hypothetical protein